MRGMDERSRACATVPLPTAPLSNDPHWRSPSLLPQPALYVGTAAVAILRVANCAVCHCVPGDCLADALALRTLRKEGCLVL